MHDMRGEPAGWYRDPDRPNLHRFWTGERWNDWVGEELASLRAMSDARVEEYYADERACG
jgi:hypothetical protein